MSASGETKSMSRESLTITDNRTGKSYELPITSDTIRAIDLRQIKLNSDDFGMMAYDPAFTNTALCHSKITFIDGDKGILRYRGYAIEELAERSTYLETAYLLLHGELPTKAQLDDWTYHVTQHTFIHESIKKFLDGFHYDAHPMGMMISAIGALSTFYPDAKDIFNEASRKKQTWRLIGKVPTLAAFAYRHSLGMPYAYPDNDLSYPANFLNMLFKTTELKYRANPVLERALDILFILHADHEQNCSANAMRCVGSCQRRSAAHAGGHRVHRERAGIYQAREGRREEADGLRPSHLQELRSARANYQEHCRPSVRGDGAQPAAGYCAGGRAHRAAG
jgi:citrate synthase